MANVVAIAIGLGLFLLITRSKWGKEHREFYYLIMLLALITVAGVLWLKKKKTATSCDLCCYYVYDEDDECYVCDMNLDEDDMVKFLTGNFNDCPFFKSGDEYAVVRKQM